MNFYRDNSYTYLEKNLENIFSRKELKKEKQKRLRELNTLLTELREFCDIDNRTIAYYIVKSYETYNELVRENPKIKNFYNKDYHKAYIHARIYASNCFMEEENYVEEIMKNITRYKKTYGEIKLWEAILPKHKDHIITLAFLEERLDNLRIKNKKWKTCTPNEACLIKEYQLEKTLIY